MSDLIVVEVAVDQPVDQTFSYLLPARLSQQMQVGMRALVPFGRRKVTGYILGKDVAPQVENLKEVEACLDKEPVFSEKMLELFRWISSYYMVPIGEVIKSALPPGINSSSQRFATLTDAGHSKISEQPDDKNELLSFLLENGESPLSAIEKSFGKSKGISKICRLAENGFVSLETKVQDGRTNVRKEKFVSLSPESEASSEKLSKRAVEIIEYLKQCKDVSLTTLLKEMSTTRPTLKKLEDAAIIQVIEKEVFRDPFRLPVENSEPPVLNSDQQNVMSTIKASVQKGGYAPFLLDGKTGSGKTEIYLRTIDMVHGKAIVLIPEISLTPQLTARFRERFGDKVAVLHSRLSSGERYDQWRRIKDGTFDIVVGARSAIFAPFDEVRVIIVDEEHEASYKQEDGIKYNARDLALVRGKMEDAIVILGSATPSLESVHNVKTGKLGQLLLPERVQKRPLPAIEIVDMTKEHKQAWLSRSLEKLLIENLEKGEQSLLFLNRRGFAPFVLCSDCGHTFSCPHCSVTLTWHQKRKILRCHYCDYKVPALPLCSECGSDDIKGIGSGTEKIEENLQELLPEARIARLDRDTVKGKGDIEKILHSFEKREIDILIGTQMIAKGHHFPGVTLVGVLMADLSLNLPDFRAAERTYQLLTQVAGRAGRGDLSGRVVIQTFNAEHYAILPKGEEDSHLFYEKEMALREAFSYPPFSRLLNFRVEGNNESDVINYISRLKKLGEMTIKSNSHTKIEILGPAPSPISRIKSKHRWHMLIKCNDTSVLHKFAKLLLQKMKSSGGMKSGVRISADFDPSNLL